MELFLTSTIHAVAHDIAKSLDLSEKKKLVFITTPVETKEESSDLEWLRNDRQSLVAAGFEVQDYTITGKTKDQLESDMDIFDFIYMSGGDTSYLLEQSKKSGFIACIRDLIENKGKIYIGTSAGSIIAGPKIPNYFSREGYELGDGECYGLVNFTILPHWGSEHFREKYLSKRLATAYKEDQVPLLLLTDTQYVRVRDHQMEIKDVSLELK